MSAILKFIRENHILAVIEQAIVKKKSRICLNTFEMIEIPHLLYSCVEVEHLYLHKNSITTIPVEITQLVNLTTLTLDFNNITSLPPEIGNLKNLVNLNISYNPLGVLTPEICLLENLEAFWCNRIGLREIPKEIGKLTKLDTFGARGNSLTTIPDEMTKLNKLRWLTLEYNNIETLPSTMDRLESLVHCNLRNNQIQEFPNSLLKCPDLMFLQLNTNRISSLPDDFDTSHLTVLEMIDLRGNPICDLPHVEYSLVRLSDALPPEPSQSDSESARAHGTQFALNATARVARAQANGVLDLDLEQSSVESSEDWENSVDSTELDVQYQSDDERADNDIAQFLQAVGMVLPELSRYASTAS